MASSTSNNTSSGHTDVTKLSKPTVQDILDSRAAGPTVLFTDIQRMVLLESLEYDEDKAIRENVHCLLYLDRVVGVKSELLMKMGT